MLSKVLLVVLISCAAILAAPTENSSNVKKHSEYENLSDEDFIQDENLEMQFDFTHLVEKLGGAIKNAAAKAFENIGDQLDTQEYNEAIKKLKEIYQIVYDEDFNVEADSGEKKDIKTRLQSISETFEKMIDQALENIKNSKDEKVKSEEFVKKIEDLKAAIKKIFFLH